MGKSVKHCNENFMISACTVKPWITATIWPVKFWHFKRVWHLNVEKQRNGFMDYWKCGDKWLGTMLRGYKLQFYCLKHPPILISELSKKKDHTDQIAQNFFIRIEFNKRIFTNKTCINEMISTSILLKYSWSGGKTAK